MGIREDKNRFLDIVKGKIRKNLSKYITSEELVGRRENEYVKIPIPEIDIPNFRFGSANEESGVGSGEGEEGESTGQPGDGSSQGKAGEGQGEHSFQAEFNIDELVEILAEELSLPKIKPKGKKNLNSKSNKYSSLAPIGPKGLKHFKSTYKRSLKRSIASGTFDKNGIVIPIKDDFKYKAAKLVDKPETSAVIFYIMDVSGSMGEEQKKIVQTEVFWINAWLKKNYNNLDIKYIVHDSIASEVDENGFYSISSAGGTIISSSYELCKKMIESNYPVDDWNIYVFQFSDGDNWSTEDTNKCIKMLESYFFKIVNSFNYGQVNSSYGSGDYGKKLSTVKSDKLVVSNIFKKSDILGSIKDFLGKGK